jgi:hypothetical protein
MTLFLDAKTPVADIFIDYIEVILTTGEQVSLNWDYSGIDRFEGRFSAKYSGVYFGEEYANGRIEELKKIMIVEVGYYTETETRPESLEIESMYFVDRERTCYTEYNQDFTMCFTG